MVEQLVPSSPSGGAFADGLNNNHLAGEEARLRQAADQLDARYLALVNSVHARRQTLSEARDLAEDFHRLAGPLKQWLDETGKKVSQLCKVVTTPEEIERNLVRQEQLQAEIDAKRDRFDETVRLYGELAQLVGSDDENELDAQVRARC